MRSVLFLILILATCASAQKSIDAIAKQIRELKVERSVTATYDEGGKTSKIMVVAENFGEDSTRAAGVEAMNFGMAFFFPGKSLDAPPAEFNLTFWVMNKKPRFARSNGWQAVVGESTIDLGEPRYVARASESMEYLNFKISPENLEKIANSEGKFTLGGVAMRFTPEHLRIFKALLKIVESE